MRHALLLTGLILAAVPSAHAQYSPAPAEPSWPVGDALPARYDWIQLKSREWVKGELIAMYEDDLLFDSEEFGAKTYDWKDLREVRTARTLTIGLIGGEVMVGRLMVVGETATVFGAERLELPRSRIQSITPGIEHPFGALGGKVSAGATMRQGNVDQVDANVKAEIELRRVHDRVELDYLANYYRNEGVDTTNDQRVTSHWKRFVTDRFFLIPVRIEWFRDPLQNLDSRTSVAAGLGYQLVDSRRTEWQVATGLAYQQTVWSGVEVGEDDSEQAAAFVGSTGLEQEWTSDIDFKLEYTFYLTQEAAGRYIHHALVGLETEWTDTLDFDVTLYWDRTESPRANTDGTLPEQDDFRMVISLGIEF